MPSQKLTETFLKTVERPSSGTARYWDTEIKGFVAHVQKTTTTLYYDRDNRRHLIGKFPTVKMDKAREAARDLDYRLRRGYARHVTQSNPMIGEMLQRYIARPNLRSERYKEQVKQAIERDLRWATKRALDITPEMCRDMHLKLAKRGPTLANMTLQYFNTVWNFARRLDRNLPECPGLGLEWYPEKKALNAPIRDLAAWKKAVDALENPVHRAAYIFGLVTGLRRSELQKSRMGQGRATICTSRRRNPAGSSGCPSSMPITAFSWPCVASTSAGCSRPSARAATSSAGTTPACRAPCIPSGIPSPPSVSRRACPRRS